MDEISAGLVENQGSGNLDVSSTGRCGRVPKKTYETCNTGTQILPVLIFLYASGERPVLFLKARLKE